MGFLSDGLQKHSCVICNPRKHATLWQRRKDCNVVQLKHNTASTLEFHNCSDTASTLDSRFDSQCTMDVVLTKLLQRWIARTYSQRLHNVDPTTPNSQCCSNVLSTLHSNVVDYLWSLGSISTILPLSCEKVCYRHEICLVCWIDIVTSSSVHCISLIP